MAERHKIAFIGAVLLLVAGAYSYSLYPPSVRAELSTSDSKSYVSGRYGIAFLYPTYYRMKQEDLGSAAPLHHAIVLVDASLPRSEADATSSAILIDMYENEPEYMSALDFIHAYPSLDWRMGTNEPAFMRKGTLAGYGFDWASPYRGRSFVVARKGFVYAFSLVGSDEKLAADFDRIIDSTSLAR